MAVNSASNQAVERYAVIGNPIAHSKSPTIHAAFAAQTGQNISYDRVLAPLDGFDATVKALIAKGYKGVNVTVPFKFAAYQFCNVRAPQAQLAGAVNTMIFTDFGVLGHNTDGAGLVRDIVQNLNTPIAHKRVLLLGAGGAAEGVYQPLIEASPTMLVVANRTQEKAQKIIEKSSAPHVQTMACNFDGLAGLVFDIVINATSTGLNDTALPIPDTIFAPNCLAYDMMYGRTTPFMKQAQTAGAHVVDGLGMLVEQAAEAFYLWRGVRPDTPPVMQMMRAL